MKKVSEKDKRKAVHKSMVTEGVDVHGVTNMREVQTKFKKMVANVFENGINLRGNQLKVYTGPTLELLGDMALDMCLDALQIKNYTINGDYLSHPDFDNIRLDNHLYIDNVLVLMQEDRAWVDKPFASMKYTVIQDVLTLPYNTITKISSEIIFPILCWSYDVTERTFETRNYQFKKALLEENMSVHNKYGDYRIQLFNISGQSRSGGLNYFTRGFSETECDRYIEFVYKYLENYKNDNNS
jgi:hypothetical protein